jgi:membrane protease subunit (stomatin/prohibitin family)
MGWFGKKKGEIDSDYVDVESMPIAVAVMDSPMAAPSAPPSSQNGSINTTAYAAMPQQHQQQQVVTHQHQKQQQQQQQQQQPAQHVFLSRIPTMMNPCPFCNMSARTRVRTAPNWATWISALILLFLFWPICWIPFVADSMKQTDHFCTSCHQKVGTVGPFKDCCVKNRY